jgi:hypothetical protein
MRVVAFDMGQVNFAFSSGICTAENKNSINFINNVMIDCMQLNNFMKEKVLSPIRLYEKVFEYLDQFDELWKKTDVILIEQQYVQRHATNIKALKLSQHVLAYFLIKYQFSTQGKKKIVEYAASNKTQYFQQKFAKKIDRKQWAIQKVHEQLSQTDPVAFDWFQTFPKKDDVADCILMIWTFLGTF